MSALQGVLRQCVVNVAVDSASSVKQAVEYVEFRAYDLILLDLGLPGLDGFSFLKTLKQRQVGGSVVVVSSSEEPETVRACLVAGAVGFIPKSYRTEQMRAALRQVIAGEVYLPEADWVAEGAVAVDEQEQERMHLARCAELDLTPKHYQVLLGLAEGLTNKQIAARMFISVHTVKAYNAVLYKALNTSNRLDTVMEAIRLGLLSR